MGASCDLAVVGGGLVGLSLAYEATCLGASVRLLDAGHAGRATDAGAGILSPATTVEDDPEMWEMIQACGRHYPRLLERLSADGADAAPALYTRCGVLSIGLRPHEDEWFGPFARLVRERSPDTVQEIDVAEARALFPPLGKVHRVLHSPEAARVDGRGMAAALREALHRRGVVVETGSVSSVVSRGENEVAGVRLGDGQSVESEAVAICGGAWSRAMGEWLEAPLPVGPTKGQIVHLQTEGDTESWPIAQPLLTHYLVPWPGGRVACGGTFEPKAAFDTRVTVAGVQELLRECLVVAPGLGGADYLETRVGLRPTSADERALVGRVPGWHNVWVATGHGANGLLQGPYSARLLAHRITGQTLGVDEPDLPPSFDPGRFG